VFIILALATVRKILDESLYIGMLLLLFAASLGVPIPEDIPLLLGGALCRLGYGELAIAIPVGLVGVLSGDVILYWAGRRFGMGVLNRRPFRYIVTPSHVDQMKEQFRTRGNWIIFFGRFFAGIRAVMCVTSGLCRVPIWKFILIDLTGALCTVPFLVLLGYWFSGNITKVISGVATVERVLGLLAIIGVGVVLFIHLSKRSKLKQVEHKAKAEIDADRPAPAQTKEENRDGAQSRDTTI